MNTTPFQRLTWRAVREIHPRLIRHFQHRQQPPPLPEETWQRCRNLARQCERARARGWNWAAEKLQDPFPAAVWQLRRQCDQLAQQLEAITALRPPLSPQALYEELLALTDEFDDIRYDFRARTLTVRTEPIVLEEVDLGPFEIVLDWENLDRPQPYEVLACQPQPAASESDIVHPHIQRHQLCEGEGRPLITWAVEQGRLADFFLIVRQILCTYNPDSAYVQLAEWNGTPCIDCGLLTADDERNFCRESGEVLCGDCSSGCADCEETFSANYLELCAGCPEYFCTNCTRTCPQCRKVYCFECLDETLCQECQQHVPSQTSGPSGVEVSSDSAVPVACEAPAHL